MGKVSLLIGFLLVALTTSLRCHICNSPVVQSCRNTTFTATCSPDLAQQTINYALQYLAADAPQLAVTSSSYHCVFDYISTEVTNHSYLGCAYSTLDICNFIPWHYKSRRCGWCIGDECNRSSVSNASGSTFAVIVGIILVYMY